MNEFEPRKKKIDENPVAILLQFLEGQKQLLANPPHQMDISELVDTKILVNAIEKFILEFNAAVYEVHTLRESIKLIEENKKTKLIL